MKTIALRFSRVTGTEHTYDVETEWRSGDFVWCGRIVLQPWEINGTGYRVTRGAFDSVAQVYPTWKNIAATVPGGRDTWSLGAELEPEKAQQVRREAQRQRRNRNARDRYNALLTIGLKRTPYGWE